MATSIAGIPVVADGEILTAGTFNALGTAITNKFGGAIDASNMVWPLKVRF